MFLSVLLFCSWLYWWVVCLMVMATIMVIAMALMALKIKIAWSRFCFAPFSAKSGVYVYGISNGSFEHFHTHTHRHSRASTVDLCFFFGISLLADCCLCVNVDGFVSCVTMVVKMVISRDPLRRTPRLLGLLSMVVFIPLSLATRNYGSFSLSALACSWLL